MKLSVCCCEISAQYNTRKVIDSIFFSKFIRCKRICSDHRDFIKCSKELTHRFFINDYPMTIINKQWQKVVNIQRVNLLNCKEIKASARLPIIHTFHPSVERVSKTISCYIERKFHNNSRQTVP